MAINVTLGEAKTQSEKPFPKLMICTISELIVFFKVDQSGIVVHSNSPNWQIGDDSIDFDMSVFTDYNEPITLQNA